MSMAMIWIEGVAIASPKSLEVKIMDLDSKTFRTAQGILTRDRIAVKRSLSMSFPPLTNAEISTLLGTITDTFFSVTYPDPLVGGNTTKTFYVGDRTSPMLKNGLWESVSFDFIEQ
jgi:hypothetical protein